MQFHYSGMVERARKLDREFKNTLVLAQVRALVALIRLRWPAYVKKMADEILSRSGTLRGSGVKEKACHVCSRLSHEDQRLYTGPFPPHIYGTKKPAGVNSGLYLSLEKLVRLVHFRIRIYAPPIHE
ncbi:MULTISPECIES: hypothetical protein [unclassified Rhizobium]|uniref:hypothetical protein n=1 Tax=unclassified Rhizobium TaxID=2613769 RepID=UPI00115E88FE|nr:MULTISPECIES: hypothetical protein [unclassified Rhizobium]TQX90252.1 hypothetical protein EQW76_11150 [Rhizobium sp. rho-13.1]TQY16202.1 hypothetical protein EQW74_10740 [Rhizobium sp. rho-1.1]